VFLAAAAPLCVWVNTRTPRFSNDRAMSTELSVDPSSTTITSFSGQVCASADSKLDGNQADALWHGTMMLTLGPPIAIDVAPTSSLTAIDHEHRILAIAACKAGKPILQNLDEGQHRLANPTVIDEPGLELRVDRAPDE